MRITVFSMNLTERVQLTNQNDVVGLFEIIKSLFERDRSFELIRNSLSGRPTRSKFSPIAQTEKVFALSVIYRASGKS
jgi:hypothetical protein